VGSATPLHNITKVTQNCTFSNNPQSSQLYSETCSM